MSRNDDLTSLKKLEYQQHDEYLRCLLSMTYRQARQASAQVNTQSFGDHWHAAKIHEAITRVATADNDDALLVSDVNAELVSTGELTNSNLHNYWLDLVSPLDPRPLAEHRAGDLARKINETAFRHQFHKVFSSSHVQTTFARPLDDLVELISINVEQLRDAYKALLTPKTDVQIARHEGVA